MGRVHFIIAMTEYDGNIEIYTTKDTATTARRRIFNSIGYNIDNTYYHYIKDHIGNICAVVNSVQDTAVQSTLYYASGVPLARSFGRDVHLPNQAQQLAAPDFCKFFTTFFPIIGK